MSSGKKRAPRRYFYNIEGLEGTYKIRMRGRVSAKGNKYWQIYVEGPHGRWANQAPWGWTPQECWRKYENNYKPYGYLPQRRLCLSIHVPA